MTKTIYNSNDMDPGSAAAPLLIDSKAAAMLLGLSSRTLWAHTNSGAIPSRKIGRAVRYCPAELRAWIDAGCPTKAWAGKQIRRELSKGVRRG